ncbi:hypothetical protein [Zobellia roscoffensis]
MENYYTAISLILLTAGIIHGLTLLFSNTTKRKWLKMAGIYLVLINVSLSIISVYALITKNFDLKITLGQIHQFIYILSALLPLFFIFNFIEESKKIVQTDVNGFRKLFSIAIAGILITSLILAVNLVQDKISNTFRSNIPSSYAQQVAEKFEARTYISPSGDKLPYRLLKPLDYDPKKQYPIAVCLHHGGGNGIENVIQIETSVWARTLADSVNRKKYPAFLFVPQCPPGSSFGGIPNSPEISVLVFEAIADVESEFRIDTQRRYVLGLSLGGFGSWHFAGVRPDMFAAIMPVCGGGNPEHAPNLANVPVWAFHGAKDSNVPVGLSRIMIEGIKEAGGKPKYNEFENEGHDIWKEVNAIPGKFEWLFSQKKD